MLKLLLLLLPVLLFANAYKLKEAQLYAQQAQSYYKKGAYQEALESYHQSLELIDTDNNPIETIILYKNIAILYTKTAQYDKARYYFQKIYDNKTLVMQYPNELVWTFIEATIGMGDLSLRLHNYSDALKYYNFARSFNNNIVKDQYIQAVVLTNIATLLSLEQKYHQSLEMGKQAIALLQQSSTPNHLSLATMYATVGKNYHYLHEDTKALNYYQKSFTILKTLYGDTHLSVAPIYSHIAEIFVEQKEYDKALKMYNKALSIKKNAFHSHHPSLMESYRNLALVYSSLQNFHQSYRYAQKAFELYQRNRSVSFSILQNQDKLSYAQHNNWYIDDLLKASYFIQTPAIVLDAFYRWANYKRSIYDYENALWVLYEDSNKSIKTLIDDYRSTQQQLSYEYKTKSMDTNTTATLEDRLFRYETTLNHYLAPYVSQEINISDIQKALKPNELYIDFASLQNTYIYFAVTKDRNVTMHTFRYTKEQIDNEIKKVNRIMNKISKGKFVPDNELIQKHLSLLHKAIIADMNISKNIDTFIISPDGLLNLVPFEALFDGKRYLIEDYTISYIPSAKEFVKLSNRKQKSNKRVDIFANPDYESNTTSSTRKLSTRALKLDEYNALPYTLDEAKHF